MLRRPSAPPFDVRTPHFPARAVAAPESRRAGEQILATVAEAIRIRSRPA